MPKSGSDVLKTLQISHQQVADKLREIVMSMEQFQNQIDGVSKQIDEEFSSLAKLFLPELNDKTIDQTPQQFRKDLRVFLDLKKKQTIPIREEIESLESDFQKVNQEFDQTTSQLSKLEQEENRLKDVVAQRLKSSQEFQDLVKQTTQAELRLASNEDRLQQVKEEAKEKLPSFHNSGLFMYLQKKHFGTPKYKSWGLTRFLDRWLANYIDFKSAIQSYQFLTTTPVLMAEELENRRKLFQERLQEIETLEERMEREEGLAKVRQEILDVEGSRETLTIRIDSIGVQLETLLNELTDMQSSNCQMYQKALVELKGQLADTEKWILKRNAEKTKTPEDDRIVSNLFQLEKEASKLEGRLNGLNENWLHENKKLKGIDEIIRRFRSNNFDSYRSKFSNDLDLKRLIEQYFEGRTRTSQLWEKICRSQEFGPSWAEKTATEVFESSTGQVIMSAMGQLAANALGDLGKLAKKTLERHYKDVLENLEPFNDSKKGKSKRKRKKYRR